ncbi:MAG: hypothetical protein WC343_06670 [Bacilli bacterium]|jgi:hypothetical protein
MGLRAWGGFIGASLFCVVFYAGILPAWNAITAMCALYNVDPGLMAMLDKVLYWAPFMILIAALIHAVISPAYRQNATWRD